jgi:hypothetical protein
VAKHGGAAGGVGGHQVKVWRLSGGGGRVAVTGHRGGAGGGGGRRVKVWRLSEGSGGHYSNDRNFRRLELDES